jgi:hypothetical protein
MMLNGAFSSGDRPSILMINGPLLRFNANVVCWEMRFKAVAVDDVTIEWVFWVTEYGRINGLLGGFHQLIRLPRRMGHCWFKKGSLFTLPWTTESPLSELLGNIATNLMAKLTYRKERRKERRNGAQAL